MSEQISYYRVTFKMDPDATPIFSDALDQFCTAVTEFENEQNPENPWIMEGYNTEPFDKSSVMLALEIAAAATGVAVPEVEFDKLEPRDWVTENLKSFTPISVGRFFVHGSHHQGGVPASKIALEVDAGLAFGSGEHQTTKGCLMAVDRLAKQRTFYRTLDMGCGSGILGLASAKLFKTPVMMSDIDPLSVKVARLNARNNRMHNLVQVFHSDGFRDARIGMEGPYDMIYANILAKPLRAMAGDIAASLTPDGVAVLSGLLNHQEQFVLSAYREHGMSLVDRIRVDGWSALVVG